MKKKAVFFDRDGVLLKPVMRDGKVCGPHHFDEFEVNPQAVGSVAALSDKGFLIFIVTNQPDISRNQVTLTAVRQMNQKLVEDLGGTLKIQDVVLCEHDNHHLCHCRKPKPGMILDLASKWPVDLERSFMVGDRSVDIEAGWAAGLKTILLSAAYNGDVVADYRAKDLRDACDWIIDQGELPILSQTN